MDKEASSWEVCRAPLPAPEGRGRRRRFCSAACRKAAHRQGRTRRKPKAKEFGCRHCGQPVDGKGTFCSDACYYHAHRHALPFGKMHLTAWDEALIPWVPLGQQSALDLNRPDWHRWVYGGAEGPK